MFSIKDVNKKFILTYLNYRKHPNGISDILTEDDFEIVNGGILNEHNTVDIIPVTNKFTPLKLTETYYNDVVLYIASIDRNEKIDKIIKK